MAKNFEFSGEVVGIAESIERAVRKVRPIDLKINDKASLALGRISSSVKDFDKSLEAAQARTLAFGASVGIIAGVSKAFTELVKTTIAVEKSLIDINVVLGESQSGLAEFSTKLFAVAKKTGQSFKTVAEGALELSRQGLNGEETLKRLTSAMVLTRLSGLDAAAAVETLTATINGFAKEGLSHVDIVNRMANVDAKFAVSSRDLAEALSRVGASAQDAGVSFNELLALVTSVQQQTARGGSVIGNSLKTIFTRIGRGGTLEQLGEFGVAIRDASGNARSAIDILESLASTYDNLGQAQQNSLAELVGGVYQINILKTLVRDLARDQGIYANALDTASKSTDQATKRNEELNKSIAALGNEALENLRELSSQVGNLSFGPAIRDLLKGFNSITSSITESLNGDDTGQSFAKSFLKGFGNYLSGSGSILILSIFLAILSKTASFVGKAIKETIGLNSQVERQQRLRLGINQLLENATALERASIANATSLAEKQQLINNLIRDRITLQNAGNNASLSTAGGAVSKTFDYDETNKTFSQRQRFLRKKPPSFADGYMPSMMEETMMIKSGVGGASPRARPVVIPNFAFGKGKTGPIVANSDEYIVKNYANGGSAIFNPDMVKKFGLPKGSQKIAASGYIPGSQGGTGIDPSKFSARQLQAMLSKGAQVRFTKPIERFGAADPGVLTEDELLSTLNKLDLGPTSKEKLGGRSIRQVVQSRLTGGNKALEQAIGSLVYKKVSVMQAIAAEEVDRAANNGPQGLARLNDDYAKQEINKFQTGKRTRTTYKTEPTAQKENTPEVKKEKLNRTAFEKAVIKAGKSSATVEQIIGRLHGQESQSYWQNKDTEMSAVDRIRNAESYVKNSGDMSSSRLPSAYDPTFKAEEKLKDTYHNKRLTEQEKAHKEELRSEFIARRRLKIDEGVEIRDPELVSKIASEKQFVLEKRAMVARKIADAEPRKRSSSMVADMQNQAQQKQMLKELKEQNKKEAIFRSEKKNERFTVVNDRQGELRERLQKNAEQVRIKKEASKEQSKKEAVFRSEKKNNKFTVVNDRQAELRERLQKNAEQVVLKKEKEAAQNAIKAEKEEAKMKKQSSAFSGTSAEIGRLKGTNGVNEGFATINVAKRRLMARTGSIGDADALSEEILKVGELRKQAAEKIAVIAPQRRADEIKSTIRAQAEQTEQQKRNDEFRRAKAAGIERAVAERQANLRQRLTESNVDSGLKDLRSGENNIFSMLGFGNPEKKAEQISNRRRLGTSGRARLADAAQQARFGQTNRLQNTMLATSFGASIASGFVPQASNALNLGGAGLSIGSLLGPKGAGIGLLLGGAAGAIKDLNSLDSAIEEMSKTADKASSTNTALLNSLQEYATAQGTLNDAIKAGSSNGVISSLTDNLNNILKGIRDPKVKAGIVNAGGDVEKISDLISRQSVEGQSQVDKTALPVLIAKIVKGNQNLLNINRPASSQEEQEIARGINNSTQISPDALLKMSQIIESGTTDKTKLREGFESSGLDKKSVDTLFDDKFLGGASNTLASILNNVVLLAKAEQGVTKLTSSSKQLNAAMADTSRTLNGVTQKSALRADLENIRSKGSADRDSIAATGNLEIAKASLSQFDAINFASQINKNKIRQDSESETAISTEKIRQKLFESAAVSPRAEISRVTEGLTSGSLSIEEILKSINLPNNDSIVITLKDLLAETVKIRAESEEAIKAEDLRASIETRIALENSRSKLASTPVTNDVGQSIIDTLRGRNAIKNTSNATSVVKTGSIAQTSLSALKQAEDAGVILNSGASKLRGDLEATAAEAQLNTIAARLIDKQDETSKAILDSVINQLTLLQGPSRDDALKSLTGTPQDKAVIAMDNFSKSVRDSAAQFAKSVSSFSTELQTLLNQENRTKLLKEGFKQEEELNNSTNSIRTLNNQEKDMELEYKDFKSINKKDILFKKDTELVTKKLDSNINASALVRELKTDTTTALKQGLQPNVFAEGESLDKYKGRLRELSSSDRKAVGFEGNISKDSDIKAFITKEIAAGVKPFVVQSKESAQTKVDISSKLAEVDKYSVEKTQGLVDELIRSFNKQYSLDKENLGDERASKDFKKSMDELVASLDRRIEDLSYAKSQGATASALPAMNELRSSTAGVQPVYTKVTQSGILGSTITQGNNPPPAVNKAAVLAEKQAIAERVKQDIQEKTNKNLGIARANAEEILKNDKEGLYIKSQYEEINARIKETEDSIANSSGVRAAVLSEQLELIVTQKEALKEQVAAIVSGNVYFKARLRLQAEINRSAAQRNLKETLANPLSKTEDIRGAYIDRGQTAIVGEQGSTSETTFLDGFKSEMEQSKQSLMNFTEAGASAGASLKSNLAGSFTDFITGAQTASEAIKGFGASVLKTVAQLATQKAVEFVLGAIFNSVPTSSYSGGSTGGPTSLGSYTQSSAGGGPSSLGSFSSMKKYASGGMLQGGSGMSDDLLVRAMGGEFIVNKEATAKHYNLLKAINAGEEVPRYAEGGPVGQSRGTRPMSAGTNGGISVSIYVTVNSDGKATDTKTSASGGGMNEGQGNELGKMLRGVVVEEIINQQRPGGVLARR